MLYKTEPLFLKPLFYPGNFIFSRQFISIQKQIRFRSFNVDDDLEMIHRWINMEYTSRFWRLAITVDQLKKLYYSIQRNSNAHSYIGFLEQKPICQFDVYRVLADELSKQINVTEHDCGFHLLMAPNEQPVAGLTQAVITAFLDYYFSFPEASIMYAEPDVLNDRSNRLLQKTGFSFIEQISMSYKTANLYSITKEQFHATQQSLIHQAG
jgi:hypothetical protein